MSDFISRQDAIDALERIFNRCEEIETHLPDGDPDKTGYKMFPDYMTVWKYLRQLPSTQQQQWIPCSDERLPKEDMRVIVQYGDGSLGVIERVRLKFWNIINSPYAKVVAWMPAPEPWKGGTE